MKKLGYCAPLNGMRYRLTQDFEINAKSFYLNYPLMLEEKDYYLTDSLHDFVGGEFEEDEE